MPRAEMQQMPRQTLQKIGFQLAAVLEELLDYIGREQWLKPTEAMESKEPDRLVLLLEALGHSIDADSGAETTAASSAAERKYDCDVSCTICANGGFQLKHETAEELGCSSPPPLTPYTPARRCQEVLRVREPPGGQGEGEVSKTQRAVDHTSWYEPRREWAQENRASWTSCSTRGCRG